MTDHLSDIASALLSAAQAAGAGQADVVVTRGTSLSISVRDGALEEAERSEGIDLGLRVLLGQRQAIVSASNVAQATMDVAGDLSGGTGIHEVPVPPAQTAVAPRATGAAWHRHRGG